ncbi:unnamed protein product [Onchocerca flexuosa]|uniref:Uncharacterized protein n=1 Tax=Onchocerca flexuosa TaxID=387005 RepID=A0A183I2H1_9BILA|nr:unnamed protein product [Onchocerca flexuosa]
MDVTQTLNEEHNAVVEMIDKTAVPMGRYPNIYKSPQPMLRLLFMEIACQRVGIQVKYDVYLVNIECKCYVSPMTWKRKAQK